MFLNNERVRCNFTVIKLAKPLVSFIVIGYVLSGQSPISLTTGCNIMFFWQKTIQSDSIEDKKLNCAKIFGKYCSLPL